MDNNLRPVSVLLPSYNEADNLPEVIDELRGVLESEGIDFEIVVLDDGSTDESRKVIATASGLDPRLRSIHLRRNFGKSIALAAGFADARGKVILLMDADGQDDPHEIPKLLAALQGGLDLVTGQRATRRDRFIKRTTSVLFNSVP